MNDHKKKEHLKYALLGRNISYSLSPTLHNTSFAHYSIPAEYSIIDRDIPREEFSERFKRIVQEKGLKGLNVTVPYKTAAYDHIRTDPACCLDRTAQLAGAVNTVKVEDDGMAGYNTDGEGFYRSLTEDHGYDPGGKKVLILGAGGAGRTICLYLAGSGSPPGLISVHDIDPSRLSRLAQDVSERTGDAGLFEPVEKKDLEDAVRGADLVINATPIGTREGDPLLFDPGLLRQQQMVYDLVYARETELLRQARLKGIKAAGGRGMLVKQAAVSFGIWTGKPVNETTEIMRRASGTTSREG